MMNVKRFLFVVYGLFIVNSALAYTITYDCGTGGGTAPASATATLNDSFTPATNTCTKDGYVFSGWLVGGTNDVKPAGTAFTWTYTENKTLTAQWTANTININWWNGDTQLSVQNAAQSCNYGGTLNIPTQITKPGYAFNGWKVRDVPGGCKRIEYIESNGTDVQYIDTEIPGDNNNYRIVIDFMMLNLNAGNESSSIVNSDGDISNYNTWRILLYLAEKLLFYTNTHTTYPRPSWGYSPKSRINYRYSISMDYNHLVINGTEYIYNNLHVGTPNNATIKLFPSGRSNSPIKLRIYSFMVYDNENLIRNMVPIKDSNNVVCMYDKVSGQFFYNSGSGSFNAGPDVGTIGN